MNKKQARLLAEKKGIEVITIGGLCRFRFADNTTALIDSVVGIERVVSLEDVKPISVAPANAVSLEGLTQEERDAKVAELQNSQCEEGIS